MSDVFLSYAKEDVQRAEEFASALAADALVVWWDRSIPLGRRFEEVIDEELSEARCVVVLWTRRSINSRWVKAEATIGYNRNVLMPVLMDDVRLPFPYGSVQAANLMNWKGSRSADEFVKLLEAIQKLLQRPSSNVLITAEAVRAAFTRWRKLGFVWPSYDLYTAATAAGQELLQELDEQTRAFLFGAALFSSHGLAYWTEVNKNNAEVSIFLLQALQSGFRRPVLRVGLALEHLEPELRSAIIARLKDFLRDRENLGDMGILMEIVASAERGDTLAFWREKLPDLVGPFIAKDLLTQAARDWRSDINRICPD